MITDTDRVTSHRDCWYYFGSSISRGSQLPFPGFGKSITSQDDSIPPGHEMSFKQVLKLVSEDVFVYILTGDWFPGVTKRIQGIQLAFKELRVSLFSGQRCIRPSDIFHSYTWLR